MSTKRKTKAQREVEQKAALLQRITDVYSGAVGDAWDSEAGNFADAEVLARVMPALSKIFGPQNDENEWMWSLHNLGNYEQPEDACEFLFRAGIRA